MSSHRLWISWARGAAGMAVLLSCTATPTRGDDCNGNLIDDAIDLAEGTSPDCNGNGIPDECDIHPFLDLGANQAVVCTSVFDTTHADVDGDGDPDMIAAGGGFSWSTNGSNGRFSPITARDAGDAASGPCATDIDLDGDLDVFVSNRNDGTISFFRNSINQTFLPQQVFECGAYPRCLHAADFDGDGGPDLALTAAAGNELVIFVGNAQSVLLPAKSFPLVSEAEALTVGDFDDDGDPDIAVVYESLDSVGVLRNVGNLIFNADPLIPAGDRPMRLAAADMDGDGITDFVVSSGDSLDVRVLISEGAGFEILGPFPSPGAIFSLATGDVDGDGRRDLVAASGGRPWLVYRNLGGGDLAPFETYDVWDGHGGANSVACADANGDGRADVFIAEGHSNQVAVAISGPDGMFISPAERETPGYPEWVFARDFDGDGDGDYLVAGDGGFSFVRNLGGEQMADAVFKTIDHDIVGAACGDTDGDGDEDLLIATSHLGVEARLFRNNGKGGFSMVGKTPIETDEFIGCGDTNGDGLADLVTSDTSEGLRVLLSDGVGGFAEQQVLYPGGPGAVLADLDGDGDRDIAVGGQNAQTWINTGGQFGEPIPLTGALPGAPVGAADIDGDGDLDLASAGNGVPVVHINKGQAQFAPGITLPWGGNARGVVAADLNRDGLADLLVLESATHARFGVLVSRGHGQFGEPVFFERAAYSAATADLDGDGGPDIVVTRVDQDIQERDAASVVWNRSAPAWSADADRDGVPDECAICYADFALDGTLDLFDFLAYVNAFNAESQSADCNGDGGLDLFDFLCFVNLFNAGC